MYQTMTRRERKEARLARRQEWADKAVKRSETAYNAAHTLADQIPLGQPILVGHHSQHHAERDAARIDANMRKGYEAQKLAQDHASRADGIADQLDRSIFSDDSDAIEKLQERIDERTAELERRKYINVQIRKGDGWAERITPPLTPDEIKDLKMAAQFNGVKGYPSYAISNLRANIRRDQQRLTEISAVPTCQLCNAEITGKIWRVATENGGRATTCTDCANRPEVVWFRSISG